MPPALSHLLLRRSVFVAVHHQRQLTTATAAATPIIPPLQQPTVLSVPKPTPRALPPPTISYLPTPSNDPNQAALPAPALSPSSLNAVNTVFTSSPPQFLFSSAFFRDLPQNSYTPEICVLGRSNVGKSTLVNALSGTATSAAGRTHGLGARRGGLAITSAKAGCTKTMNGYGFGKAPISVLQAALKAREEENKTIEAETRSERRAANKRVREKLPQHGLVLVDMPGYGFNSLTEWGTEIEKYLTRRKVLKGAVVLVDAEAGVKKGDRRALEMLRDAKVPTTVVLTKGDKLGYQQGGLDKACLHVWQELRRVEGRRTMWREGKGWEREIWVTGAGDPKKSGGLGGEGARWAICKMAGLVQDTRALEPASMVVARAGSPANMARKGVATDGVKAPSATPEIVPFSEIVWATPSELPPVPEFKEAEVLKPERRSDSAFRPASERSDFDSVMRRGMTAGRGRRRGLGKASF